MNLRSQYEIWRTDELMRGLSRVAPARAAAGSGSPKAEIAAAISSATAPASRRETHIIDLGCTDWSASDGLMTSMMICRLPATPPTPATSSKSLSAQPWNCRRVAAKPVKAWMSEPAGTPLSAHSHCDSGLRALFLCRFGRPATHHARHCSRLPTSASGFSTRDMTALLGASRAPGNGEAEGPAIVKI